MNTHPDSSTLSALLEGDLEGQDLLTVESHLATCGACAAEVAALRATLSDLALLTEPAMDEKAAWAIRSGIAAERRRASTSRRWSWIGGSAAAGIIAIAAIVLTMRAPGLQTTAGDTTAALESGRLSVQASSQDFTDAALRDELVGLAKSRHGSTRNLEPADAEAQALTEGSAGSGGNASSSAPPVVDSRGPATAGALFADEPQAGAQRCFATQIAPGSRDPASFVRVLAARYAHRPAYIYFLELPAANPTRLELWVLDRESCTVRYFRQVRLGS